MAGPKVPRVIRIRVRAGTVVLLLGAFAAAIVVGNVIEAAHRPIGWFVAATLTAGLLAPFVAVVQRVVHRALAVGIVLLVVAAFAGVLVYGLFQDVSTQMDRLERAVPEAAVRLEEDERFGEAARDFRLSERASDAVDGLGERLTGEAQATARSVGAYLATTVLVIFMLTWSTRFLAGALTQIDDLERRARVRRIVLRSLRLWRGHILAAIGQALVFGVLAFVVCRLAGVPAPVPLALWVGLWTIVPYVGLLVGMVPILLLSAGLDSIGQAVVLLGVFVGLQAAQVYVQQAVNRRTLYVGPAVILFVALLGYALYALGGALASIALVVLGLAVVDSIAVEGGADGAEADPPPEALDPTAAPATSEPA